MEIHPDIAEFKENDSINRSKNRLFTMVGRITGPLSHNIKVKTIEKKVIVGLAVQ